MPKTYTREQFKKPRERGGGNIAKGWTGRKPPTIDVLLHKEAPCVGFSRHEFKRVAEVTRNEVRTAEVWSYNFNCHEDDDVLDTLLRRRTRDDRPENPPAICPGCLCVECVREMVNGGKLKAHERVFEWRGDDPTKAAVFTAGGIAKMFNDKMTEPMRLEMRQAGLTERVAWRQALYAKSCYALARIEVGPSGGVADPLKIAIEKGIVGDKLREAARDRCVSKGEEDGDIWLNPAVVRFEFFREAKAWWDMYKVTVIEKTKVTDEMLEAISGEAPDVEAAAKPGNVHQLRGELEAHALVDLPWDEIFGPAEEKYGPEFGDKPEDEAPPDSGSAFEMRGGSAAKTEPLYECDACDAEVMLATDTVCPACGAKYDAEGNILKEEPPPPPPKQRRKRSEAAKAKPAASPQAQADADQAAHHDAERKKPTASRKPAPPPEDDDDDPFKDEGDEIPWGKG